MCPQIIEVLSVLIKWLTNLEKKFVPLIHKTNKS